MFEWIKNNIIFKVKLELVSPLFTLNLGYLMSDRNVSRLPGDARNLPNIVEIFGWTPCIFREESPYVMGNIT